jgi:outer membrane lipoprotein LolB
MRFLVLLKGLKLLAKTSLLLLLISLTACATAKQPLTGIVPGSRVETLQSAVGISAKSGERSTAGRGYLVFKEPDRFHMAVLSPFGLTMFDVFSDGDRLTCSIPSRQTAYSGLLSELPDESALKSLGMMRWVVEPAPPQDAPGRSGELVTPSGEHFLFDENGLVLRKVSAQGDEVIYHDYRNVNGVAFPEAITIGSRYGATVKISFEEPEINQPVDDSALTPILEGFAVLPLADFRGL